MGAKKKKGKLGEITKATSRGCPITATRFEVGRKWSGATQQRPALSWGKGHSLSHAKEEKAPRCAQKELAESRGFKKK